MHTIAPAAQRRRPAGAAWLIVVVVLGVLAMHGLSGHGMSSASDVEMTLTPDTPSSMAAPGHTVDAADQVAPAHPDHGMSATGMMCVAVLAGAVLLVLLARRRPLGRETLAGHTRIRLPSLAVDRRSTGPPSAWKFSVIRC